MQFERRSRQRPDAAELIEIRNGKWPFEKVEAWAFEAEQKVIEALAKTKLSDRADIKTIDRVVQEIVHTGTRT